MVMGNENEAWGIWLLDEERWCIGPGGVPWRGSHGEAVDLMNRAIVEGSKEPAETRRFDGADFCTECDLKQPPGGWRHVAGCSKYPLSPAPKHEMLLPESVTKPLPAPLSPDVHRMLREQGDAMAALIANRTRDGDKTIADCQAYQNKLKFPGFKGAPHTPDPGPLSHEEFERLAKQAYGENWRVEVPKLWRERSEAVAAEEGHDHNRMNLADECQTLRDENTHLLAENARLRREIERTKKGPKR
jgi:hypothetical protein